MYREQVMTALFNLVSGAYTFKSFERRLVMPSKTKAFPALFLISTAETFEPRPARQLPPKQLIDVQVWVYTDGGKDPDVAPEIELNNALDALERALAPSIMAGVQTLGLDGLVSHCWIEGTIERYPGALDGVAKAIVPIKILMLK